MATPKTTSPFAWLLPLRPALPSRRGAVRFGLDGFSRDRLGQSRPKRPSLVGAPHRREGYLVIRYRLTGVESALSSVQNNLLTLR